MRKILNILTIAAVVFTFSSCAVHSGLTTNQNQNNTEVLLQGANYTVVQKVQGKTSAWVVFGFGGAFRPMIAKARAEMLESADLIGKSRAVINEVVEVNDKFFGIIAIKTVTVSAHVVEFTGAAKSKTVVVNQPETPSSSSVIYNDIDAGFDDTGFEDEIEIEYEIESNSGGSNTASVSAPKTTTVTNSEEIAQRPADTEAIAGRWSRENDGLVITISGNVGVLTQVKTGFWARLVNNGRISIGSQVFRNFTKIDNTTWRVQELVVGATTSNWRSTTITLKDGTLIIGNPQNGYVLTK